MTALPDRPHVWLPGTPGTTAAPLLFLHGTGGEEHDLLPLREHLAATAPVLSVRAPYGARCRKTACPGFSAVYVKASSTRRISVPASTSSPASLLQPNRNTAANQYGVKPGRRRAGGFSNGADIASALLLQRPMVLAGAVLPAALVPFRNPPRTDLNGKRVAIVNGPTGPMATPAHTTTLAGQLWAAGADADVLSHEGGHTVDPQLLPHIAQFLRK